MHSMSMRRRKDHILWPVEGCTVFAVFACGAPSGCADEHPAWRGRLGAETRMKIVMVWGKVNREQGAEVLEQWRGRPGSYCVPAVNPCMALSKMHSPQQRGPARQQCNQGDASSGDGSSGWNLQRISSGHVGTVGECPRFWGSRRRVDGRPGGEALQAPPAQSQGWSRQWVGCEVDTWGHRTAGVPIFQMLVTTIINFVNDGNIDGIIA